MNHTGVAQTGTIERVRRVTQNDTALVIPRRRLPDDVVLTLRHAGIGRMALPTAVGGVRTHIWTLFESIEQLAAIDARTGWRAGVGAATNVFAGYVGQGAAGKIFADPDATHVSVFAAHGTLSPDGAGWTLSGRWPLASISPHGGWIGLGARVPVGHGHSGAPDHRLVYVPASEITVHRTWETSGASRVAGYAVSADRLPVDLDRSCNINDTAWPGEPLWQLPLRAVLAPVFTAVAIGIAGGALDTLDALTEQLIATDDAATPGLSTADHSPPDGATAELTTARTSISAARSSVRTVLDEAWAGAEQSRPTSPMLQARIRLTCVLATDVAIDVIETAHRLAGNTASSGANPLDRALADIQLARQQLLLDQGNHVPFGNVLAGIGEASTPMLVR